jgi:hypothetical protein
MIARRIPGQGTLVGKVLRLTKDGHPANLIRGIFAVHVSGKWQSIRNSPKNCSADRGFDLFRPSFDIVILQPPTKRQKYGSLMAEWAQTLPLGIINNEFPYYPRKLSPWKINLVLLV